MRGKDVVKDLKGITDKLAFVNGTTPEKAKKTYKDSPAYKKIAEVRHIFTARRLHKIGALQHIAEDTSGYSKGELARVVIGTKALASVLVFEASKHPNDVQHRETAEQLLPVVPSFIRPFAKRALEKTAKRQEER
jgi:hypothetical protein